MSKKKIELEIENRILVLRAEKKITQAELAKAINVTRATILSIEKGKYNPSLELAFKIALFFNKNLNEVFSLKGKNEKI